MFKWCCLAAGLVFGLVLAWMVNDLRQEVRRSVDTVNKDLPQIVDKSRQVAEVVHDSLPDLVAKSTKTADTLAELAADVQQLREVAGLKTGGARDQNMVAYENEVLKLIEGSGGQVMLKKRLTRGFDEPIPAGEWVAGARSGALVDLARARSRAQLLSFLGTNWARQTWYIRAGDAEPVPLVEWVKANHPPSRDPDTAKGDKKGE